MSCIMKEKRNNKVNIETDDSIYHERQVKELCALHALNNLFQDDKAFTKNSLDAICSKLSPDNWINPHKSFFGTGNYDINVLIAALQTKGCDVVWYDKRKDVSILALENIEGFILNIPTDYKFGILHFPIHRKHWISIRNLGGMYYNLDSKLDAPEIIGQEEELRCYLSEQIECKDKELLLVVSSEVERNGTWKRSVPDEKTNGNVDKTDLKSHNSNTECIGDTNKKCDLSGHNEENGNVVCRENKNADNEMPSENGVVNVV